MATFDGWAPEVSARLSPEDFERFCAIYREKLLRRLGTGPVFFAFRRVFLFARLRAAA